MDKRDEELILRILTAREGRALQRVFIKRLHRAQKAIESANSVEDIRRAQGRLEELRYFVKLKKSLLKKL